MTSITKPKTLLSLALAASTLTLLPACGLNPFNEADASAPSRPKTAGILAPDSKSSDNAFNRENEKPQRDLPTSGSEFPGHTKANPPTTPTVLTADAVTADSADQPRHHHNSKPAPANGATSVFPESGYPDVNWYPGPLPTLSSHPGPNPTPGSTHVPGTAWSIEHSWGEVLPLTNYPHRDWPQSQTTYVAADVKHNPVYYSTIQNRLPIPQNDSSFVGNHLSNVIELPWFFANMAATPVLAFFDPPLKQVTTQRLGHDPNYLGFLDQDGPIVPAPVPGIIRWDYPFLTVTNNNRNSPPPATQPIAPTPGVTPAPSATSEPYTPPATDPATTTPGLH